MCDQFAPERVLRHVVDEGLRAVDLHDGKQLAVALLELGIAGDVHLAQVESELGAELLQRRARTLARTGDDSRERVVEG